MKKKKVETLNNSKVTNEANSKSEIEENTNMKPVQYKQTKSFMCMNIFLIVCVAGVTLGLLLEKVSINRSQKLDKEIRIERPKYWVFPNTTEVNNRNGILKHVYLVLERVGLEQSTNETPWNLLWSYSYPFSKLNLRNLAPYQKVNHIPGTVHITSKVELATSNSEYIPKAFRLPKDKNEFLKYAKRNKNALFVQKYNTHRNVYIKNVSDIDTTSGKNFVQEFMQKPFLVDGHKFDIGVYVVLTSVNPLRVNWYKGDVTFRFCKAKFYPFDPTVVDKYVVGDEYMPMWEVPSLAHPYTALGNTKKEAFDIYVRSKGKDPTTIWENIQKAIAEVFIMKEPGIIKMAKNYTSVENFFEMMRFDFIVDEDLKVYMLEANMGPNLSSTRHPPNRLVYEQLLYNLFLLTGVSQARAATVNEEEAKAAENMVSSQKNIAVFGDECSTTCKESCEVLYLCSLCKPCLDAKLKKSLLTAYSEFLHRGDFRRLVPSSMTPNKDMKALMEEIKDLSPNNKLLHLWYQGKCNQDITWCT